MGLAQTPYWGIAIFEAESYEKLLAFAKDPEYLEKVVPDELKFVDRERSSLRTRYLRKYVILTVLFRKRRIDLVAAKGGPASGPRNPQNVFSLEPWPLYGIIVHTRLPHAHTDRRRRRKLAHGSHRLMHRHFAVERRSLS